MLNLFLNLSIATVAVVFSMVLIEEEGIFAFYGRLINRLPTWLSKPLGMCEVCFGGQLAFWYYIFLDGYTVPGHVFFVSWTIFFTWIVGKIWEVCE